MMRDKLFDKNLYLEGLRQTRLNGILDIILTVILALTLPLFGAFRSDVSAPETVNLWTVFPTLPIVMYCFTPLLTFLLFRFLNHRSLSDFYHGIPQSRKCLYISFSAAVFTWTAAAIVLSVLAEIIVLSCIPNVYLLNMSSVPPYLLSMICGSFLVMTVMLTAMSLTGTVFTNFILAVLLLLLPRALLTAISTAVTTCSTVLVSGQTFGLLDASWNIPAGLLINFVRMMGGGVDHVVVPISTYLPSLYTMVLGILYGLVGMHFFRNRPSEAAGTASVHRILQAILRIAAAMVPGTIGCVLIFYTMTTQDNDFIVLIIILYIAAVLLYFLFELFVAKDVRRLLRILPGLAVFAALNVIIVVLMNSLYRAELHFLPDEEEITSISLASSSDTDYLLNRAEEIRVTDKEAIALVYQGLEDAILVEESDTGLLVTEVTAEEVSDTVSLEAESVTSANYMTVVIRTKNQVKYRNICLSTADQMALIAAIADSDEMQDLYRNLPSYEDGISSLYLSWGSADFSDENAAAIYETACNEIATLSFEDAYDILDDYVWTDEESGMNIDYLEIIYVTIIDGTKIYELYVPIIPALMPDTCAMYADLSNEIYADALDAVTEYLELCISEGEIVYEVSDTGDSIYDYIWYDFWIDLIYLEGESVGESVPYQASLETLEQAEALLVILENFPESGDEYLILSFDYLMESEDGNESEYNYYNYILRFDSGEASEEIRVLLQLDNEEISEESLEAYN